MVVVDVRPPLTYPWPFQGDERRPDVLDPVRRRGFVPDTASSLQRQGGTSQQVHQTYDGDLVLVSTGEECSVSRNSVRTIGWGSIETLEVGGTVLSCFVLCDLRSIGADNVFYETIKGTTGHRLVLRRWWGCLRKSDVLGDWTILQLDVPGNLTTVVNVTNPLRIGVHS